MGIEAQFVEAGGLRWRVAIRQPDAEGRTPLLLLNGLGASLEIWEPFMRHFPADLPLIRLDAPGVGRSETPRRPLSMKALAHRVGALLDALGHEHVDVLGISWGGLLAQHVAAWLPRRCRRLVLVSTAPCIGAFPGRLDLVREMVSRRRYVDPVFAQQVAGRLYGGTLRDHPELVHVLHGGIPASPSGYLYQWMAGLSAAGPPFMPGIDQPTLILSGDDDPIIPAPNARILRSAIPNARMRIFHDGHLGLLLRADELAPIVADFLTRDGFATHSRLESMFYLTTSTARHLVRNRQERRPPAA
jgi:poly(3-hydroxyalkanoate) depolymerase